MKPEYVSRSNWSIVTTRMCIATLVHHHTAPHFQFGQASWPARTDVMIMTQQKAIKPKESRSILDSRHF